MRHAIWARSLLAAALCTGTGTAGMVARRWGTPPSGPPPAKARQFQAKPPTCYAAETAAPPTLDGQLDDAVWRAASPCTLARTLDGAGRAVQPTEVRLLRDAATLYVAVRCGEPLLDKLKTTAHGRDGEVWLDDSIEIFLSPGGAYYQIGVNAAGAVYDSRVKDAAWHSGAKAAAGRERGAWTLELAIPLVPMTGKGKTPTEWTANFTRNRYVAGRWQEAAWSPTYSDDSHVPARFGRMVFGAPPAETAEERPVVRKQSVTVLPAEGAEGIVRFDLSDLPRGAAICRADLLVFRTATVTGASPEALTDIAIHPVFAKPAAKPLELREPWCDRFDATEAVRQWAAGKPNGGFLVKACPLWHAEATCLDVAYEGEAGDVPPPVAGVKALHRAGQTFITWREVEPLLAEEKATWGEIKAKLAAPQDACRYRVYAHDRPITAASLHEATLVGEAGPLSAWNVNARNKEYLIGQAMARPDEMGELAGDYNGYMHTWTMDSPRMDRYPVARFVIDEAAGPLAPGTGLYVHHPASPGTRHYAVVSVRNGIESTKAVTSTGPVREAVGPGEPVRQGKGLWGPFFDYPGTRWVYVQWCAPPLAPQPNMAFNWSVLVPPEAEGRVPAELYFHPEGYSYAQPGKKMLLGSIQLAPHDYPPSGWHGFNDAWGTLKSFKAGTVRNHTQRRILAFLDWAGRALPIDRNRVLAVGADGAAALALAWPDRFSYVLVTRFDRNGVLEPKAAGRFAAAWGPRSPDVKDERGRSEWRWAHLDELVRANAGRDLPLFVCRGASWGGVKGWGKGRGRFYDAMHQTGQPLVAHWAWGGKLQRPDKHTGLWRGLDVRRDTPIPAFANCSLDQEGEGSGNTNLHFSWKVLRDEPDRFATTILGRSCTFDLTPRRLQEFRAKPGERLRWQATPLPGRRPTEAPPKQGQVEADGNGVVTVRGLEIPQDSGGLTLTLTRRRATP
jgi:hypothetical protein